jgi:cytidine deaminase
MLLGPKSEGVVDRVRATIYYRVATCSVSQAKEQHVRLDQGLVDAARELLERRFPGEEGIAAAMYTDDGDVLTSVFFEPEWGSGMLCAETGSICEAEKLNKRVTASVCVSRLSGDDPVLILTPCGICQERLFHWGENLEVAVPDPSDPTRWTAKTLKEVQPYYWVNAFG